MTKQRASFFDELPELDVSAFTPKPDSNKNAPTKAQVKAVTESRDFKSREASMPTPAKEAERKTAAQRRVLRTGRNVQFNVKASQEVIDDIYAITDAYQGWVLGYTLERAIAALKRELAANPPENRRSAVDADAGSEATGQGTATTARV